jgi:hypothetical protein
MVAPRCPEMKAGVMHLLFALTLTCGICLPVLSLAQSTNLTPVRCVQHADEQRIDAALRFLEQRVIARDDEYFFGILDSLVEWNAQEHLKVDIVQHIRDIYDCRFEDVNDLANEFVARGGGFLPYFHISGMEAQRFAPQLSVGDTVTYRISIATASDLPVIHSLVTLRKLHDDATLPVMNYKISRIDNAFLEAISSYHRSYIVRYAGDTGGLRSEWLATDTPKKLWDFIDERPRSCVETFQGRIAENTLVRIPIEAGTPGGQLTFQHVNRETTYAELGMDIAGHPEAAFAFYQGAPSESHTMLLFDQTWRRVLITNLQSGLITSQPRTDAQKNQHGLAFKYPGAMSVSGPQGGGVRCWVYDNDSCKLHEFNLDLSEPTGLAHQSTMNILPSVRTVVSGSHVVNTGGKGDIFISGTSNDSVVIAMGYTHGVYRRYIGYTTACDSVRFVTVPSFNLYNDYFLGWDDNAPRSTRGYEQMGIVYGSTFIITGNQKEYASGPGLWNEYLPVKNAMNFMTPGYMYFVTLPTVSRHFDGHYMVTESHRRNLIHIFEPFDGNYVCSWSIAGGFHYLRSCRQVRDSELTGSSNLPPPYRYEMAITDLVVLEDWWMSRGLSRFLTAPELLGLERRHAGDQHAPDILAFTVSARAEMSIHLLDSLGATVSMVEAATLRDPRQYLVAVPNPDRHDILLTVRSADIYNYGAHVQSDKEYLLRSDGSVIKEAATPRTGPAALTDCHLYPNPGRGRVTLGYTLLEAGDVTILITDLLGRTLYKQSTYLSAPGGYRQDFNLSRMAAGRYHVRILTGSSSHTLTLVKQ